MANATPASGSKDENKVNPESTPVKQGATPKAKTSKTPNGAKRQDY